MKNVFHVFSRMFTKFLGEHPFSSTHSAHLALASRLRSVRIGLALILTLFAAASSWATDYITDVMVLGGDKSTISQMKSDYEQKGWIFIDDDLNDGAGGDYVHVLYKKSSGYSSNVITDIIIKTGEHPDSYIFNGRTYYRAPHDGSEYFKSYGGNLNSATTVSSSTNMRLYYTKEEFSDKRAVSKIAFTVADDNKTKTKTGYTTLGRNGAVVGTDGSGALDLNEGAGSDSKYIYMHISTVQSVLADAPEYITDVVVFGGEKDDVNALKERYASQGWVVIDQDLNDGAGSGTDYVYLAYKKSPLSEDGNGFITDFIIKTDDYPDTYEFNGRTYYRAPNFGSEHFEAHGGNLNSGTRSSSTNMRLYFTREKFSDNRVVDDIAFTTGEDNKTKNGYTTLGKDGAAVGSDGSGALDLNEGVGYTSDYIYMLFTTAFYNTVTFVTGDENVSVPVQTIVSGAKPARPDDPKRKDFKFLGWYTTANGNTEFDFSAPVASNTTVYAKWAPLYSVTFVTGDKNISVPTQSIVSGETPTRPDDPERAGLKFKGWFADEAFVAEFDFSAPVTKNATAYAKWEASVTFVTGDDNISVPTQTVVLGNTLTEPTDLKREGYKFIGWYTTADGNTQFDFSAPVTSNITVYAKWWNGDLSILTSDGRSYVAEDGFVLRGKLASNSKISIADGATVTLDGVRFINQSDAYRWAGITCEGDCKIFLKGKNAVFGTHSDYPGIYVPENRTLTIEGDGSLSAHGSYGGAGIGGGSAMSCGNITINGGTITASSYKGAGIGGGVEMSCGSITINGGTVTAISGTGAGIGSGEFGSSGDITISGGTVTAIGGGPDGGGSAAGIGGGRWGACGNITINGGTVTATGGGSAAGIGRDFWSSSNDFTITITDGVISLTAYKGEGAFVSIGGTFDDGRIRNCVVVSINGSVFCEIETNAFVFQTYDVEFDANGGSGVMEKQRFASYGHRYGPFKDSYIWDRFYEDPLPLSKNVFTRQGYMFMGWNTEPDGSGTAYADEAEVQNLTTTPKATVTLYAQWRKTVQSLAAIVISEDGNGKLHATINGDYAGTDKIAINEQINVENVVFNREFAVGVFSTLTLPFDVSTEYLEGSGMVLTFNGLKQKDDGKWVVRMKKFWEKNVTSEFKTLDAYTPYLVLMDESSLKVNTSVQILTTKEPIAKAAGSNWEFRGTLAYKKWEEGDSELGRVYGFAAESKDGIQAGQFVKAGAGAYIYPLRAYLLKKPAASGVRSSIAGGKSFATMSLPDEIDVEIEDDDGNEPKTTVVGKFNTRTGEFRMNSDAARSFDVKGRNVGNKANKARGAYYKKGGKAAVTSY